MGNWWRREAMAWRVGLAGECRTHGAILAAVAVGIGIVSVLAAWLFGSAVGPGGAIV